MVVIMNIFVATLGVIQDTDSISIGDDTSWIGERYPILVNGQETGFYLSSRSNNNFYLMKDSFGPDKQAGILPVPESADKPLTLLGAGSSVDADARTEYFSLFGSNTRTASALRDSIRIFNTQYKSSSINSRDTSVIVSSSRTLQDADSQARQDLLARYSTPREVITTGAQLPGESAYDTLLREVEEALSSGVEFTTLVRDDLINDIDIIRNSAEPGSALSVRALEVSDRLQEVTPIDASAIDAARAESSYNLLVDASAGAVPDTGLGSGADESPAIASATSANGGTPVTGVFNAGSGTSQNSVDLKPNSALSKTEKDTVISRSQEFFSQDPSEQLSRRAGKLNSIAVPGTTLYIVDNSGGMIPYIVKSNAGKGGTTNSVVLIGSNGIERTVTAQGLNGYDVQFDPSLRVRGADVQRAINFIKGTSASTTTTPAALTLNDRILSISSTIVVDGVTVENENGYEYYTSKPTLTTISSGSGSQEVYVYDVKINDRTFRSDSVVDRVYVDKNGNLVRDTSGNVLTSSNIAGGGNIDSSLRDEWRQFVNKAFTGDQNNGGGVESFIVGLGNIQSRVSVTATRAPEQTTDGTDNGISTEAALAQELSRQSTAHFGAVTEGDFTSTDSTNSPTILNDIQDINEVLLSATNNNRKLSQSEETAVLNVLNDVTNQLRATTNGGTLKDASSTELNRIRTALQLMNMRIKIVTNDDSQARSAVISTKNSVQDVLYERTAITISENADADNADDAYSDTQSPVTSRAVSLTSRNAPTDGVNIVVNGRTAQSLNGNNLYLYTSDGVNFEIREDVRASLNPLTWFTSKDPVIASVTLDASNNLRVSTPQPPITNNGEQMIGSLTNGLRVSDIENNNIWGGILASVKNAVKNPSSPARPTPALILSQKVEEVNPIVTAPTQQIQESTPSINTLPIVKHDAITTPLTDSEVRDTATSILELVKADGVNVDRVAFVENFISDVQSSNTILLGRDAKNLIDALNNPARKFSDAEKVRIQAMLPTLENWRDTRFYPPDGSSAISNVNVPQGNMVVPTPSKISIILQDRGIFSDGSNIQVDGNVLSNSAGQEYYVSEPSSEVRNINGADETVYTYEVRVNDGVFSDSVVERIIIGSDGRIINRFTSGLDRSKVNEWNNNVNIAVGKVTKNSQTDGSLIFARYIGVQTLANNAEFGSDTVVEIPSDKSASSSPTVTFSSRGLGDGVALIVNGVTATSANGNPLYLTTRDKGNTFEVRESVGFGTGGITNIFSTEFWGADRTVTVATANPGSVASSSNSIAPSVTVANGDLNIGGGVKLSDALNNPIIVAALNNIKAKPKDENFNPTNALRSALGDVSVQVDTANIEVKSVQVPATTPELDTNTPGVPESTAPSLAVTANAPSEDASAFVASDSTKLDSFLADSSIPGGFKNKIRDLTRGVSGNTIGSASINPAARTITYAGGLVLTFDSDGNLLSGADTPAAPQPVLSPELSATGDSGSDDKSAGSGSPLMIGGLPLTLLSQIAVDHLTAVVDVQRKLNQISSDIQNSPSTVRDFVISSITNLRGIKSYDKSKNTITMSDGTTVYFSDAGRVEVRDHNINIYLGSSRSSSVTLQGITDYPDLSKLPGIVNALKNAGVEDNDLVDAIENNGVEFDLDTAFNGLTGGATSEKITINPDGTVTSMLIDNTGKEFGSYSVSADGNTLSYTVNGKPRFSTDVDEHGSINSFRTSERDTNGDVVLGSPVNVIQFNDRNAGKVGTVGTGSDTRDVVADASGNLWKVEPGRDAVAESGSTTDSPAVPERLVPLDDTIEDASGKTEKDRFMESLGNAADEKIGAASDATRRLNSQKSLSDWWSEDVRGSSLTDWGNTAFVTLFGATNTKYDNIADAIMDSWNSDSWKRKSEESVKKLCDKYGLGTFKECYASKICTSNFVTTTGRGASVTVGSPAGGSAVTLEASRSLPINDSSGTSYVYTVEFYVQNPLKENLSVSVELRGSTTKTGKFIFVAPGASLNSVGSSANIWEYSESFSEVCLRFSPKIEDFKNGGVNIVCSPIIEAVSVATGTIAQQSPTSANTAVTAQLATGQARNIADMKP
ncbi:hypothetical protein HY483_02345 [Candidatus Woesearchaeota archaeon]|nr:hypothetical protein [Candidatus Woesearchaeota archaeon]